MTARNVVARLVKLEAGRKRTNEVLLVWRRPDADVREAVSRASFSAGDKVICAEWFDDAPMPAPRWYSERLTGVLDDIENANLTRTLGRISDTTPRDPAFAAPPFIPQKRIVELTDNDLLHAAMGVST